MEYCSWGFQVSLGPDTCPVFTWALPLNLNSRIQPRKGSWGEGHCLLGTVYGPQPITSRVPYTGSPPLFSTRGAQDTCLEVPAALTSNLRTSSLLLGQDLLCTSGTA